jgi:hypothetical protein
LPYGKQKQLSRGAGQLGDHRWHVLHLKNSLLNVIKKKRAKENLWWFYCWRIIVFRKEEDAQGENFLSWLWWVITAKNRRRHSALSAKDADTSGVLPWRGL